jgi:gp16 family phage-associated protein
MTAQRTPEKVKEEFSAAGISIREWASAHGFSYEVAKSVLSGRIAGKRGEAHRIALALGLKTGSIVEPSQFMPPPPKQKRRFAAIKGGLA